MPETVRPRSEREIFQHFSARHDLSVREREVLRYLLEEKTNQEIAEELSISEGTVKYHIHNLLQKTSCRNRLDLLSVYAAEHDT
jgi:RNA polymerase sigma factor (sigma-70 family)